jgi:hypothetical protein
VSPRATTTYTAVARTRVSPYGVPFFPCPTFLPHVLSHSVDRRSGTVAPILSRHSLEVTQAVCSLSNTRRINTGCLVRQVCSVAIPRYPQFTELITGDSSVRVCTLLRFPGPLPAHSHNRCGIPKSISRSTLSIHSSTLTRATSSPSPGHPLFLQST